MNRVTKITSFVLCFAPLAIVVVDFSNIYAFLAAGTTVIATTALFDLLVLRYGQKKSASGYFSALASVFFLLGLFGGLLAVSALAVKLAMAFAAGVLLYLYKSQKFAASAALDEAVLLSAAALLFATLWGINFYFARPWYILLALIALVFFPFLWQAFYATKARTRALELALFTTLIIAETAWPLLFFPTHFLTTALIQLSIFYLIFHFSKLYFTGRLTRSTIYFQAGLAIVVMVLGLLSSPWSY